MKVTDGRHRIRWRDDPWYYATFEGAAEATLLRGAELTFAQRLAAVEELDRLAEEFRRADVSPLGRQ
jgi:hypothetical protein